MSRGPANCEANSQKGKIGLLSGGLLDSVISQLPCAQEVHTYKHFWLVVELTRIQPPRCPALLSNLHGLLGPFSSQVSDPLVCPISGSESWVLQYLASKPLTLLAN